MQKKNRIADKLIRRTEIVFKYDKKHPGLTVLHDYMEPQGLSITEAARRLGISRQRLSSIVNCKAKITPEIAVRLEIVFGEGAETWCRMQAIYDVDQARKAGGIHVERIEWEGRMF